MSSKAWVESRVSRLLAQQMAYTYKPVDVGPSGGATKLDILVVTPEGYGGAVEVKQTHNQMAYNPHVKDSSGISAGQRAALDAIAVTRLGIAWVALWRGTTCFFFDWRHVCHLDRWQWSDAFEQRTFRTWDQWLTGGVWSRGSN